MAKIAINGITFLLSDNKLDLYTLTETWQKPLIPAYEIRRLIAKGFPFCKLDAVGEFWTSTKVSCSKQAVFVIDINNPEANPTFKPWDKSFAAWGLSKL
jgi:hypothetical protein